MVRLINNLAVLAQLDIAEVHLEMLLLLLPHSINTPLILQQRRTQCSSLCVLPLSPRRGRRSGGDKAEF